MVINTAIYCMYYIFATEKDIGMVLNYGFLNKYVLFSLYSLALLFIYFIVNILHANTLLVIRKAYYCSLIVIVKKLFIYYH